MLKMSFLCEVCDRSIFENQSEYMNYLATMRKKNDESLFKKHNVNIINLEEVEKVLKDYIIIHD